MLFRQGALVILAGVLPLAAAGTLDPGDPPLVPQGHRLDARADLLQAGRGRRVRDRVHHDRHRQGRAHRADGLRDGVPVPAGPARPDAVLHLDHRAGRRSRPAGGGFLQTALPGAVAVGALRGDRPAGRAAPARPSRPAWSAPGSAPPAPGRVRRAGPRRRRSGRQPPRPAGHGGRLRRSGPPPPGQARLPAPQPPARSTGCRPQQPRAAAGPAGIAVAGLAAGAASARRTATEAMQPPGTPGGDQ